MAASVFGGRKLRRLLRWPNLPSLLVLAFLTAGCDVPTPHLPGPEKVTLADIGLSLKYPSGWQAEENVNVLRWYARPQRRGKPIAGAYVTVLRDAVLPRPEAHGDAAGQLAAYVETKLQQEANSAREHQLISASPVILGGVASVLCYSEYASSTHRWRTLSTFAVVGDYGYTISASAPLPDAQWLEPVYRKLMASLRWQPLPQTPAG